MSIAIMTAVWNSGDHSGGKLLLLLALADWANDDGGSVFPSLATLALKTRMNERSVRRLLRELEADGTIERVREATNRRPTEYRIGGAYCPPNSLQGGHISPPNTAQGGRNAPPKARQGGQFVHLGGTQESPNSLTNHQKKESDSIKAEFDAWWEHVPLKVGKGQARPAYKKARKKADADTLLAGIRRYAESVKGRDRQYIAHPTTWLNGERWLDEPAPAPQGERQWWQDAPLPAHAREPAAVESGR